MTGLLIFFLIITILILISFVIIITINFFIFITNNYSFIDSHKKINTIVVEFNQELLNKFKNVLKERKSADKMLEKVIDADPLLPVIKEEKTKK